ncbi:MAG TPA: hypothetical protein VMT75_07415 [Candidatus Saccharimonadales bacterium]|nr:hypothetical protein [Candidatus Saccharimonadales bacterium]
MAELHRNGNRGAGKKKMGGVEKYAWHWSGDSCARWWQQEKERELSCDFSLSVFFKET